MPKFFLRVEGVNLANVIFDTDDLSTRRGGGLMVLNATGEVSKVVPNANAIATGASIGIFTLEDCTTQDADTICEKLRKHFFSHELFRHATFVVSVQEVKDIGTDSEYQTWQQVITANRWQQMQSLSMSMEGVIEPVNRCSSYPCATDMVRPANSGERLPKHRNESHDNQLDVSISVLQRHKYGRSARQKFYEAETGVSGMEFTDEFSEIATHPEDDHSLSNKLAVFYVDGNKFGEKGRGIFQTGGAEQFKVWSDGLRTHHKDLLRQLLEKAKGDPLWKTRDHEIRLETLLWGGDEIIWVVPAWKGWELAEWFFEVDHKVSDERLSYSGGLVFCNAKAPIQNIITLAIRLADLAKKDSRVSDMPKHALAYEVLESFDDIPGDLKKHRERWLPENVDVHELILDPKRTIWEPLRKIAAMQEFPMRQLYNWCRGWREGKTEAREKAEKRMESKVQEAKLDKEFKEIITSDVDYLHLLQMLPYIPESYQKVYL